MHRYTTRLLADIDRAMPRRHQLVLLAVVAWVAAGALAATLTRPRETPAKLAPIIIITATPHALAGRAAPPERSEAPATPTAEPATEAPALAAATPETIVIYVERAQPAQEEAPATAAPEPTAEPWHPPLVYGEVRGWDGEVKQFTCGGPSVAPPLCH